LEVTYILLTDSSRIAHITTFPESVTAQKMERARPKNISLPPLRSILDDTNLKSSSIESLRENDPRYGGTPKTAPLSFSQFNIATPKSRTAEYQENRPATPKNRPSSVQQFYPSPPSDNLSCDIEMGDSSLWSESAKTPLFKLDESGRQISVSKGSQPKVPSSNSDAALTPSIVHYRPNGIPSVKSRKSSITDIQKPRNGTKGSNEFKFRLVKWDRITDKGTAPLNVEARPTGPRSCTLCYLTKRKVKFPSTPRNVFNMKVQSNRWTTSKRYTPLCSMSKT
jgi:hypothetical protein